MSFIEVHSPVFYEELPSPQSSEGTLQFAEPLTREDFKQLAKYHQQYPSLSLRAYHRAAVNLEWLTFFPNITKLHIDLFELQDSSGLRHVVPNLMHFGMGETRRRVFSLAQLSQGQRLQSLYLERQSKDIAAISQLASLHEVRLSRISLPNLSVLLPLTQLETLWISLGNLHDISQLPKLLELKKLVIQWVRHLYDIAPISAAERLESLEMRGLATITEFPDLRKLTKLETLLLENFKALASLKSISAAPALRSLEVWGSPQLNPEDFECLVGHQTLETVEAHIGGAVKDWRVWDMFAPPALRDPLKRGLKPKKVTPGVIFEIPVGDGTYVYGQYLHSGKGLIYRLGDLVGFFDYKTYTPARAEDLIGKPWMFPPAFVGVRPALVREGWRIIGSIPVQPYEMPTFRWNEGGAWRPGVYHNWYLVHPSHQFFVGSLSPEHLKYELMYYHSASGIAERIRTGFNPDLEVR